jgi:hypothetical protein
MYGETRTLMIGSGLKVSEDGVSFNHHFLPPKDEVGFEFLSGEYVIEILARSVNRTRPVRLCTVKLALSEVHAVKVIQKRDWAVFTLEPNSETYRCSVSEGRVQAATIWER